MDKNQLNVLTYDYYSWKYPRNWIHNMKQFFRNLKWAHQRITQGYSTRDIWNLDLFYAKLFELTLKELSETTQSYPTSLMDKDKVANFIRVTDEESDELCNKWKQLLLEASNNFKVYTIDEMDDDLYREAWERYHNHIIKYDKVENEDNTVSYKPILDDEIAYEEDNKLWIKEEDRVDKEKRICYNNGLDFLKQHFRELWD